MNNNSKIKTLDELQAIAKEVKGKGKTLVQCHGTFDLLHIGHIRHFQSAKSHGDVLLVTVTSDQFVNKGPDRPVFTHQLRAEAIASLSFVDYVAVSYEATAVGAIKILKPDVFVKGSDYKNSKDDITGGIEKEAIAVSSVGGQIFYTDDVMFSSSNLINNHFGVFTPEVEEYLSGVRQKFGTDDVIRYLDLMKDLKVLVVGDAIIDEYEYCRAIGKSSKEPMIAVKHLSTERFAGGILAVANHVANFSENVTLVTVLGTKNTQQEFIETQINASIQKKFFYKSESPTIVKRRLVEEYFFTKLIEVYDMEDTPLSESDDRQLCEFLEANIEMFDAVIVVDFGHGTLTNNAVDIICRKSEFLVVNSQANAGNMGYNTLSKYSRADYACVGEPEIRLEARDRYGDLQEIISSTSNLLDCRLVTVTKGKNGSVSMNRDGEFNEVPALAKNVVDRVGAGDAFLSVTSLCVALDVPDDLTGFVGNVVGAEAVATVGNRNSVERLSLIRHIETLLK